MLAYFGNSSHSLTVSRRLRNFSRSAGLGSIMILPILLYQYTVLLKSILNQDCLVLGVGEIIRTPGTILVKH